MIGRQVSISAEQQSWPSGPIPAQQAAERRFPVRVRASIPPEGLGPRLSEMHEWLRLRYGPAGYFVGQAVAPDERDAMHVYVPDIARAAELAARFGLAKLITVSG